MYVPATEEQRDLLAFRLQLARKCKLRAFLSTGKLEDKRRLLPSALKLFGLGVQIYATEGTSAYLTSHGIETTLVSKIHEHQRRDVRTLLREGLFGLVINILTDNDRDERSDARIIRRLALEHRIPIITDVDFAVEAVEQFVEDAARARARPQPTSIWDYFMGLVEERGGFADNHGHYDKAYLVTPEFLDLGHMPMQQKWILYRTLKENYTHEDLVERILRCVEFREQRGVMYQRTMVDADTLVGLKCIKAALEVKQRVAGRVVLEVGIQPLEGVLERGARKYVEEACAMADFIGGLPSREAVLKTGTAEQHLDVICSMARDMGKNLDVHVDQKGTPDEDETRLLARFAERYHLEGRVAGIHSIISRKWPKDQEEIAAMVAGVGMSIIPCPGAGVSMEQMPDILVPMSNSLAPVPLYLKKGVNVAAGSDNTEDPFMPASTGDPRYEANALMDICRIYDMPVIADIMCNRSLFSPASLAAAA
jgi:hypothetical protein